MPYSFRRLVVDVVGVVGVVVLGSVAAGCSTGSSQASAPGATGTSGQDPFLDLQITTFGLVAKNQVGLPLTDVTVTIKPVGYPILYMTKLRRMESTERRQIGFGEITNNDGMAFSLRTVRPKEIVVTAVDFNGAKHEMTMPWK